MAAYSSLGFGQEAESTITLIDNRNIERTENGTLISFTYFENLIHQFTVVHTITTEQKTSLLDFYNTNRFTDFEFESDIDNVVYPICVFISPPVFSYIGGDFWKATCNIIEVVGD